MLKQRTIGGKNYFLAVFKVEKSDESGPRLFSLLRDDETTHIEGGEHFWTVWVPEENLRRLS